MDPKTPLGAQATLELETLRGLFGDDDDAIREILETYVDDLTKNAEALGEALAARDRRRAGRVAHSMKGASANVGAGGFARACEALERRSADAPWEELDALTAALSLDARRLAAHVRGVVDRLARRG